MSERLTINGESYTADELAELIGAPVDYPLSDDERLAVEQAISEAENRDGPLDFLIDAAAVAVLALLFLPGARPGVRYVESRQQYYRGRVPLPESEIERRVTAEQQRISRRTHQLGKDLSRGRLTLEQYQQRMAREIYQGTIRMMSAGNGGLWTDAHYEALQRRLWGNGIGEGSLARLQRHIERLQNGELTEAQLLARSRMYGAMVFAEFFMAQHLSRSNTGQWQARRSLDPSARHCPDCPALEVREWRPANEVTPRGMACRCGGNCRCNVEYRLVNLSDRLVA